MAHSAHMKKKRHFQRKLIKNDRSTEAAVQICEPTSDDVSGEGDGVGEVLPAPEVEPVANASVPVSREGEEKAPVPKFIPHKLSAGDHAIAARLRERSKAQQELR